MTGSNEQRIFRDAWKQATNDFNFYPDCTLSSVIEKRFIDSCEKAMHDARYNDLIAVEGPKQARLMILQAFLIENEAIKTVFKPKG